MSDRPLPPDRSSWPTDPYRLLGVGPEVSPRDLRKAYLNLVRSYKPEHAPEEFRLIRAAYEALKDRAELLASWRSEGSEPADPEPAHGSAAPIAGEAWPGTGPDPWERAAQGEFAQAYHELAGLAGSGAAREEVYLQLYWLLTLEGELDRATHPSAWLVRGLLDRASDSGRLALLLGREVEFDPALAVGEALVPLRSPRMAPGRLVEIFGARWKAARALGRWDVIHEDVDTLRGWVPDGDEDVWPRLLIAAAMNLAWAPGTERVAFTQLKNEVQASAHRGLDLDGDLTLIEYAERAAAGLLQLWPQYAYAFKLYDLLRLTWNQPWPAARPRLRAHLAEVASDPLGWLRRLALVKAHASASLHMLMNMPDELCLDDPTAAIDDDLPEATAAIVEFLAAERWWDYPLLRPRLLAFCIAQMVSPALVAGVARDHPRLRLADDQHLADTIEADWPLFLVFRGCASVRG